MRTNSSTQGENGGCIYFFVKVGLWKSDLDYSASRKEIRKIFFFFLVITAAWQFLHHVKMTVIDDSYYLFLCSKTVKRTVEEMSIF